MAQALHRAAGLLLALLVAAAPAAARGEDDLARAREAWEGGKQLFDRGEYRGALSEFRRGFELSGKGGFLYNMAECQRLLGDKRAARRLYRRYLRRFPRGSSREDALAHCRALGLGECQPAASGPDRTSEDGAATQPAASAAGPPDQPAATEDGAGAASAGATSAEAGQGSSRAFLPPAGGGPQEVAAEKPVYEKWWFWTSIAAAAAVVAGGVTAGVVASGSGLPAHDYRVDFRSGN